MRVMQRAQSSQSKKSGKKIEIKVKGKARTNASAWCCCYLIVGIFLILKKDPEQTHLPFLCSENCLDPSQ